ncbi:MAG: hypothetical protein M9941_17045 [Anaerolineae bacterium]|nr:hypothetical protein [Anaerolineae bacterium]
MIKLPAEIVYYAEPYRSIETLLCWIPSAAYPTVAADDAALTQLRRFYPDGVELRVDREELAEMGVELNAYERDLVGAYQWLRDNGRLPQSGMVTAQELEPLAQEYGRGALESDFDTPWSLREDVPLPPPIERSAAMTVGDSAETVFAVLSGTLPQEEA